MGTSREKTTPLGGFLPKTSGIKRPTSIPPSKQISPRPIVTTILPPDRMPFLGTLPRTQQPSEPPTAQPMQPLQPEPLIRRTTTGLGTH